MSLNYLLKIAQYYEGKYKFGSSLEIHSVDDFWQAVELEAKKLVEDFMTKEPGEKRSQEHKDAFEMQNKIYDLVDKYFLIFKNNFFKELNKENLKDYIEISMQEELESLSQELL